MDHSSCFVSELFAFFECGFDELALEIDFALELFFAGEVGQVFGGKDLIAFVQDGAFGGGFCFFGAEDQADGRIVAGNFELILIELDITIHLTNVRVF